MSVAEWFHVFTKNLRISNTVVSSIQARYAQITKRINIDYWGSSSETDHSLYVGSYGRGTAIHVSDVDVILVLPYETYGRFCGFRRKLPPIPGISCHPDCLPFSLMSSIPSRQV